MIPVEDNISATNEICILVLSATHKERERDNRGQPTSYPDYSLKQLSDPASMSVPHSKRTNYQREESIMATYQYHYHSAQQTLQQKNVDTASPHTHHMRYLTQGQPSRYAAYHAIQAIVLRSDCYHHMNKYREQLSVSSSATHFLHATRHLISTHRLLQRDHTCAGSNCSRHTR